MRAPATPPTASAHPAIPSRRVKRAGRHLRGHLKECGRHPFHFSPHLVKIGRNIFGSSTFGRACRSGRIHFPRRPFFACAGLCANGAAVSCRRRFPARHRIPYRCERRERFFDFNIASFIVLITYLSANEFYTYKNNNHKTATIHPTRPLTGQSPGYTKSVCFD